MRWAFLILTGCNAVFGLRETEPAPVFDAAFFDALIDAPFTCPAYGTAPVFRRTVHTMPVPIVDCKAYSFSRTADRAIASCWTPTEPLIVEEGNVDAGLERATTPDVVGFLYFEPRLSADGDAMVRVRYSLANPPDYRWTMQLLKRDGALVWGEDGFLPYDRGQSEVLLQPFITNISAGPDRRMFYIEHPQTGTPTINEYGNSGGGWQLLDSYPMSTIESSINHPSLSSDGLRLVYLGSANSIHYVDRPTKSDRFVGSQILEGVPPGVDYPALDDNCGKLYFSALGTIFYVQQ